MNHFCHTSSSSQIVKGPTEYFYRDAFTYGKSGNDLDLGAIDVIEVESLNHPLLRQVSYLLQSMNLAGLPSFSLSDFLEISTIHLSIV